MSIYSNWCRTCGSEGSESKKLQDVSEFQDIVLLFTYFNDSSLAFVACEECLASLNMIQKFSNQCSYADTFFTDLLKSFEEPKKEELKKVELSIVFKKETLDDSFNLQSQTSAMNIIEFDNTELMEPSPQTRSLRLRQRQSVVKSPPSVIPSKIFSCDLCNKHFSLKIALVKHMESIHIISKIKKKLAPQRKKLIKHAEDHNCDQCKKSFRWEKALKNHQKTHSIKRKYDCTTCQKSFSSASCLKSHLDTHSDTSYICPECGLKLNTKRTLRQHMLKHSDFKRFKCNICGSEFKRAKSFKEHLLIHSDLRPYSCMWCDKTFKSGANCRKHKKEAHPIELAESDATGSYKSGVVLPKLEELMY